MNKPYSAIIALICLLSIVPFSLTGQDDEPESDEASSWSQNIAAVSGAPEELKSVLSALLYSRLSPEESIRILKGQLNDSLTRESKSLLYNAIGDLQLLMRQPEDAAESYFKAYTFNAVNISALVQHAKSLLLTGENERAISAASRANLYSDDWSIKNRALFIVAQAEYHQNHYQESLTILQRMCSFNYENGTPSWLYLAYLNARMLNMEAEQKSIYDVFLQKYPNSIEIQSINGTIDSVNYLVLFSGEQEPVQNQSNPEVISNFASEPETDTVSSSNVSVQIGAFSDQENAEYMVEDLKQLGYIALVEATQVNGTNYYKVLIPDIAEDELQNFLLGLRDSGFDGYPIR